MDDESLKNLFTEEEIEEMIAASGKNDLEAALPAHLEDLLKNLARKVYIILFHIYNTTAKS